MMSKSGSNKSLKSCLKHSKFNQIVEDSKRQFPKNPKVVNCLGTESASAARFAGWCLELRVLLHWCLLRSRPLLCLYHLPGMGSSVQRCSKNPRLPTLAETPWRKLSPLRPRFSWMCSRKNSFGARKNMEQKHADVKQPSADEKTPATPKRWREKKKDEKRCKKTQRNEHSAGTRKR